MIKFFRKIRQQLLSEGNTGKYLKYAVGEIVLVVIGILIALQINNWNEQRTQHAHYLNILGIIQSDMQTDTQSIGKLLREFEQREHAFQLSMQDTISKTEFTGCEECPDLLLFATLFVLQKRGYEQFRNYNSNIFDRQDSLNLKIGSFYTVNDEYIEALVNTTRTLSLETYSIMSGSKPWFRDWIRGMDSDRFYDLIANDPFYKNRVAQYYTFVRGFYSVLRSVRQEETALLELIDARIQNQ